MKILKALKYVFYAACIAFFLWGIISWCDIVADNTSSNPQHYDWNMFVIMTQDK